MPVPTADKRRRRRRRRAGLLLILAGLALLGWLAWRQLDPLVRSIAVTKAQNAVTVAVNNAVADKILAGELDYASIIHLEKDESGLVTALTTDMAHINRLKAALTGAIIAEISREDLTDLSVPLGNLLGGKLLSGRGPGVPIQIISVSRADTALTSRFSAAGINQTLHQIQVAVSVEVIVLIPGDTVSTQMETQVTVAETVLIGRVPDSYMYFENDENWDNALEQYDILT